MAPAAMATARIESEDQIGGDRLSASCFNCLASRESIRFAALLQPCRSSSASCYGSRRLHRCNILAARSLTNRTCGAGAEPTLPPPLLLALFQREYIQAASTVPVSHREGTEWGLSEHKKPYLAPSHNQAMFSSVCY